MFQTFLFVNRKREFPEKKANVGREAVASDKGITAACFKSAFVDSETDGLMGLTIKKKKKFWLSTVALCKQQDVFYMVWT